MAKQIKFIGEKRKHLSAIHRLRCAVVLGLNEDDPVKYNLYLEELRKELNALEAA